MHTRKQRGMLKKQSFFLLIGIIIPFVGGYLSILGITFFQANRDSSVIYFFISNIFVFLSLFRYGLFLTFESILPLIFDNISDGIIIVDTDQIILGYNNTAAHLLSINSRSSSFPIEIGLKKHPALIKLIKLPYEFGKREQIELDLLYRGTLRTFEVKRIPIFNDLRKLIGYFLILRDINDNKLIEAQLKKEKNEISEKALKEKQRLEMQLQQAQKMESIGRLAGGIAHDFNNMLTGIMGNIELLKMTIDTNSEAEEYLKELENAAKSASNLTRSLLSFSRKQMVQPVKLNLNDLIEQLAKMMKRVIGEDIILNLSLEENLPEIIADPGSIQQAILNLVVNARDAMPKGGTLMIETKNCFLDKNYCNTHLLEEPGNYVMLAVSDTGTGMSEEVKSHLFEPFFTTKAKDKGTGLGLASVYGAVTQAGGRIDVYSELNYGTTFKLYFPIPDPEITVKPRNHEITLLENNILQLSEDEVESFTNTIQNNQVNEKPATIALVEDDTKVRNVIVQGLIKKGYSVLSFSDPVDALEKLKQYNGALDLLITDVVMPKLNGKQLAESLAQQFKTMKVLYISGYTENIIYHHGVLDPNVNFLSKPFTPEALMQVIKKILKYPSF
jgi:signal transduction histidine kinase/ActR/RegA family two-component response regulator